MAIKEIDASGRRFPAATQIQVLGHLRALLQQQQQQQQQRRQKQLLHECIRPPPCSYTANSLCQHAQQPGIANPVIPIATLPFLAVVAVLSLMPPAQYGAHALLKCTRNQLQTGMPIASQVGFHVPAYICVFITSSHRSLGRRASACHGPKVSQECLQGPIGNQQVKRGCMPKQGTQSRVSQRQRCPVYGKSKQ